VLDRLAARQGARPRRAGRRRVARRDFPCELVGSVGVGDGHGASWLSRCPEGLRCQGRADTAWRHALERGRDATLLVRISFSTV
jgi:hypothetical protein